MHALHGDEVRALGLAELERLDDVRVHEQRRDLRLTNEHLRELGVARQRGQDALDDELALPALRPLDDGAEDLRHAADTDSTREAESAVGRRYIGRARGLSRLG